MSGKTNHQQNAFKSKNSNFTFCIVILIFDFYILYFQGLAGLAPRRFPKQATLRSPAKAGRSRADALILNLQSLFPFDFQLFGFRFFGLRRGFGRGDF